MAPFCEDACDLLEGLLHPNLFVDIVSIYGEAQWNKNERNTGIRAYHGADASDNSQTINVSQVEIQPHSEDHNSITQDNDDSPNSQNNQKTIDNDATTDPTIGTLERGALPRDLMWNSTTKFVLL